jgi:type IV fimbrial biogenesis protein FimT
MNRSQRGFTLIELMVTILLLAILLGFAVPSFRSLIQNNRLTTHANDFITSMNYARSEAVKRGVQVSVTATDTSDNADEWGSGWTVWIDQDADGVLDAGEEIGTVQGFGDDTTLDSTNDIGVYQYIADGTQTGVGGDVLNLCDSSRTGETGRQIRVAVNGRVSVFNIACL